MKKILQLALGIVTSVGGFLEIGSIATAAQAGAGFGYQLVWSVVLGTICIAFLVEMSGRCSAVSKHTIPDAMRERFGARFYAVPLVVMLAVSLLVLAAELGGVAAALQMATGISIPVWAIPVLLLAWALLWYTNFSTIENGVSLLTLGAEVGGVAAALELATGISIPIWAIPVTFVSWVLLWKATFGVIENGVSGLGLVTLAFAVGAVKLHPDYVGAARGLIPTLTAHHAALYWFIAVSVLGASVSPYLYYFYSSGAIEEGWDKSFVPMNRVVAAVGMTFGGLLSIAVLVCAARVFHPAGIEVQKYQQLPQLLSTPLGHTGFWLFVASLGIGCFGATLEISLALAYLVAQGFGWNWGKDQRPSEDARFSLMYTVIIVVAGLLSLVGLDPLKLTEMAMALTSASLPVGVLPFLILMNDREYLGEFTNGHIGNAVVMFVSVLAMIVAVVAIPLEIFGS